MKSGWCVVAGLLGWMVFGGCGLFGDDAPKPGRLELISEAEPVLTFSERVSIRVRYLDADDAPVADAFISFEPQQDPAGTVISDRNVQTDAQGLAETFIEAGVQEVDFDVVISVPADDEVAPITVPVRVQPKDEVDYIVRVTYDGPVTLGRVDVYLYDVERACDTLIAGWEPAAPSPDDEWSLVQLSPDAEGNIPESQLYLPAGVEFSYAVARATASDGQGGGTDYLVTFGCRDEIPPPDSAAPVDIVINMVDLWPDIEGSYQVESELDLLDVIPDSAGGIPGPVGELIDNPRVGLLRIIALAVGGEDYYTQSPWDTLFVLCAGVADPLPACQAAGEVVPGVRGEAVAASIEALVDLGLAAIPDHTGETILDVLQAGADVFDNAERFALAGNLVVTSDPDDAGLLGSTNRLAYNRITWQWSGAQRTIDLRSQSQIQGADITAALVFHPQDPEVYSLALSPFEENLNVGEILVWVLEGVVFPGFIAPEVQSFEDFFSTLIDCAELYDLIACEGEYNTPECTDYGDAVAAALEAGCDVLQVTSLDALLAWTAALAPGLQTYYQAGTPQEDPCRLSLPAGRDSFTTEALGSEVPCRWTGELRSDGADPQSLEGSWWGEKL